jgi:hypothetical protein
MRPTSPFLFFISKVHIFARQYMYRGWWLKHVALARHQLTGVGVLPSVYMDDFGFSSMNNYLFCGVAGIADISIWFGENDRP